MPKWPVSCLVLIHSGNNVLLLERADRPGYWQSVTGSWENGETLEALAQRELFEETGLKPAMGLWKNHHWANQYEIYHEWRYRYAPNVYYNTEHVFSLELTTQVNPQISSREHTHFKWLEWETAAKLVFSPSNREAIKWVMHLKSGQRKNKLI